MYTKILKSSKYENYMQLIFISSTLAIRDKHIRIAKNFRMVQNFMVFVDSLAAVKNVLACVSLN